MELVSNVKQVEQKLRALSSTVPTLLLPATREIGFQLLSWAKIDFEKKSKHGTANGSAWKPLVRATLRRRAWNLKEYRTLGTKQAKTDYINAMVNNHQIGVDTGRLRNSLNFGTDTNVFQATKDFVVVGSSVKHAKWFQEKGRPIFDADFITEKREDQINEIIFKHIDKHIEENGQL